VQFYDWALTGADEVRGISSTPLSCCSTRSSRQLGFLWRRERITYTRVLFALARYPALACAVVDLLPVRREPLQRQERETDDQGGLLTSRRSNWTRSRRVCALSPSYAQSVSNVLYPVMLNVLHSL